MNPSHTLNQVDSVIQQNSILRHPFYQAWQRGELTLAALQDYAAQYYHHVAAFPTYLSALHSHIDDIGTRQALLENLIDEERGESNHPSLWLDFAEGVGISKGEVLASKAEAETAKLISTFRSLCADGDSANGLAALYAYESQIPEVSATKIEGLTQFYGITDAKCLKYFEVHRAADVVHSADERKLLARSITEANCASVVESAEHVTTALWDVLSGVCQRHNIAC